MKQLFVFNVLLLAITDSFLSNCFLELPSSDLLFTCVYMGRPDIKHRVLEAFAESVRKHHVLQDLEGLMISVSDSSVYHNLHGLSCFTNMNGFVITLCGGIISKWVTMAHRDEGDRFSRVWGSPSSAGKSYLQEGEEGWRKICKPLGSHLSTRRDFYWKDDYMRSKAKSLWHTPASLSSSVQLQPRNTLYQNLFSCQCKTRKKRRTATGS